MIKDDDTYIFLEKETINILAENENQTKFLSCLLEYFVKKKKNSCKVFNDDGERVLVDDYNLVYVPYMTNIDSNMEFKDKSIMNVELTEFVESNPEMFQSIENIRQNIRELTTDAGMFRLRKILRSGLDHDVEINIGDFDVSKIIQMLRIEDESLGDVDKYMIIYNLLLFTLRDTNVIVYLDIPVNKRVINWINTIYNGDMIFIIENQMIIDGLEDITSCNFIRLSNENYCEQYNFDINELPTISYIFNPYVVSNLQQQTQKNIDLIKQFEDKSVTFCLNFSETKHQFNL